MFFLLGPYGRVGMLWRYVLHSHEGLEVKGSMFCGEHHAHRGALKAHRREERQQRLSA